jgi:excisionase family DNA binding protein
MATRQEDLITVAEAARRLGADIDSVLELVYNNEMPANFEPGSARILLRGDDVDRLLRDSRAHGRPS